MTTEPPDQPADELAGAGLDLGALLQQAQKMQQDLMAAQAEAQAQEVEGSSGGGLVRVRVNGGLEFSSVRIDPSAVNPDETDLLEDLVLAALRDAMGKIRSLNQQAMGQVGVPQLGDLGKLFG